MERTGKRRKVTVLLLSSIVDAIKMRAEENRRSFSGQLEWELQQCWIHHQQKEQERHPHDKTS